MPDYSGHRLANVAHFQLASSPSKGPIELPSECLTQFNLTSFCSIPS
ncbi:unnamed protein product [Callosobruchus maculatus]|uniref:Uncharacterized protein n=1 Tax=Callosobruchus maculatus TaxID=64391 RepID=A0A653DHV0_CALMS|nr:unnamed protein product [Callosobruchus maculatus]